MSMFAELIATTLIASLPLVAGAQTTTPMDRSPSGKVLAPDQPRSESERKATTENGQAPNYGQTDPSATGTNKSDTSNSKMKTRHSSKVTKSGQAAPGESPTYPADTKDGRPTGDSNVKDSNTKN